VEKIFFGCLLTFFVKNLRCDRAAKPVLEFFFKEIFELANKSQKHYRKRDLTIARDHLNKTFDAFFTG
jgi:hypothetical protein